MSRPGEIARLACADVRHEWRMSLCMMLAVAAIATPLLLFFGLKYGVIETLRHRLLDNPSSMELLPLTEKRLDAAWFAKKRRDPRVAFVVPHTRRLSAQAEFSVQGKSQRYLLDLAPTLNGDVLLARYAIEAPENGSCVLSAMAAAKIGAAQGDTLVCSVSRDRGRVRVERTFRVTGVLPDRAGNVAVAYLQLEALEQIEQFKDGRSVPELGWPGRDPLAYPVTPAAIVALSSPLDAIREAMLCQNTGFAKVSRLNEPGQETLSAFLPEGWTLYLLEAVGNQADGRDMASLADRVRGRDAYLLPKNDRLRLVVPAAEGEQTLQLLPAAALGRPLPNTALSLALQKAGGNWFAFSSAPAPRILFVSPALAEKLGKDAVLTRARLTRHERDGSVQERAIQFKARFLGVPGLPESVALAAPSLLGQLGLLADRPLTDGEAAEGEAALLLGRRGYSGFRMYARTLEQVAQLKQALEEEGIKVSTRADRIEEVLSLDTYLDILFWIIACASLTGGMGCLISNVYANVERKRRELAVLRLVGVHGLSLTVFPLTSALVLTVGGLLCSLTIFHALSCAINTFFSSHLEQGEVFCHLTLGHQCMALGLAVALAVVTGLAASRRMLQIEPAESLRDE